MARGLESAVARLLRASGYHVVGRRIIEGLEVDMYGVKVTRRGCRGVIVEMKVLYRDSLRVQVERRRWLAHRVYVALPDWSIVEALVSLPEWVGVIAYNPATREADVLRKAVPQYSLLARLIAESIAVEEGLWPREFRGRRGNGVSGLVKRP